MLRRTHLIDTGCKLNVHKMFRRCPGLLLNVLCTFNLHPVCRGYLRSHRKLKTWFQYCLFAQKWCQARARNERVWQLVNIDYVTKLIVIIVYDGSLDENPLFPKTFNISTWHFEGYNFDVMLVSTWRKSVKSDFFATFLPVSKFLPTIFFTDEYSYQKFFRKREHLVFSDLKILLVYLFDFKFD